MRKLLLKLDNSGPDLCINRTVMRILTFITCKIKLVANAFVILAKEISRQVAENANWFLEVA